MKRLRELMAGGLLAFALADKGVAGTLPADWKLDQFFELSTNGLIKIGLPGQTLNAARPGLEDLRLYDDSGREIPYLIERPRSIAKIIRPAKSFHASLEEKATVLTVETGLTQPIDAITLETPERQFIKAAAVESSSDGATWQTLVQGQPIFRQSFGVSHLQISLPPTEAKFLRLTIDDRRSIPIPFTGLRIHAAQGAPAPTEWIKMSITERDESPGETRLAVDLGAANLEIAAVRIETDEPLFTREITFGMPHISENSIREELFGRGTAYRIAVEGQAPAENLAVPLDLTIPSREIFLFIKNGDSAPLSITGVSIERHPIFLNFLARQPGTYHLLTGNSRCSFPHYDLAALGINLKNVAVSAVKISAPRDNSDYQAPEALSGIEVTGAPLDISQWKFRKALKIGKSGMQQTELDLDVLAHGARDFSDVRVELGSNQMPYIVERTSINRAVPLTVTAADDPKRPKSSRWSIKLPQAGLPLARLTFASDTPLFERTFSLYEETPGQNGEKYRRPLGSATWRQTPDHKQNDFSLPFSSESQGDVLFLETDNGDNPAISLDKFQTFRPVTRLLFKAKSGDPLFLYYGNPQVSPPRYDLSLVAVQLLAAEKNVITPGMEEQLKKTSWQKNEVTNTGGVVFWGILAVVVIVLLVLISRLLPKAQPPA